MSKAFPTASALKYAMACPGSVRLPKVAELSAGAEAGNDKHEYLAALLRGDNEAMADVYAELSDDVRKEVEQYTTDGLPTFRWVRTEVAFAYNPKAGRARVLGENLGRDYLKAGLKVGEEFAGTADFVGESDGKLVVGDWKTGNAFTVDAASDNWQLKFLAVCSIRAAMEANLVTTANIPAGGYDTVRVCIARTKEQPIHLDWADFDGFDLDAFAFDLAALAEYIQSDAGPRLVEGSHCRWCPSFDQCPAKTSLIRSMAAMPQTSMQEVMDLTLSPENVAEAFARYNIVKTALRRVESRLQGWAIKNPINAGDGKVYGPVKRTEEVISPEIAHKVLIDLIGRDAADKAFSLDTNKTALKAAISSNVPRGKGAATFREAMERISKLGGVLEKDRTELRVYKPET